MKPIDSPNIGGRTRWFTVKDDVLFAYDSKFTINAIFVDAFSDLDTITRQNMDPAAYLKNFVPFML
jgi:hypothetical protein